MPPRPGAHLDLYLVPRHGGTLPPVQSLLRELESVGLAAGRGPGHRAVEFVDGGYAGVRLDLPDGPVLYANRQGGFYVSCPVSQRNIAPAFQPALIAWRDGGPRRLTCPICAQDHDLSELDYRPPAAFGSGAVVLVDAKAAGLTEAGRAAVQSILGPVAVVGSRR